MIGQSQYRVQVIRDGFVIEARTAPAALAEQYTNVMRLLYPNDQIRCDLVVEGGTASLHSRQQDPRD